MNKLQTWISANELQINLEKSEIIVIPSKLTAQTTNLSIFYNERPINYFESSKYLGVNLDSKLNFKSHICIIENKVARSVGILSKLCYLFPSSALLLLYYSFIHPHLLFRLPLWGNANQSYLNRLQLLRNKAIPIIPDSKLRMPTNPQYYKLRILKLPELYTLEIGKLMHQYSHHTLPQPFSTFFTPISSVHERFTRAKTENKLYIPKFSTARSQKFFKYQGTKICNLIPIEIKQLTFQKFKIEYKKKLFESYC